MYARSCQGARRSTDTIQKWCCRMRRVAVSRIAVCALRAPRRSCVELMLSDRRPTTPHHLALHHLALCLCITYRRPTGDLLRELYAYPTPSAHPCLHLRAVCALLYAPTPSAHPCLHLIHLYHLYHLYHILLRIHDVRKETEVAKVKVVKVEKAVVMAEVMVEATVVVAPALRHRAVHSGPAH